jgi:signal transduction histidine kinase
MTTEARMARLFEGVEAESRSLVTGALLFRWVWMLWMAALAGLSADELIRGWLAWTSLGAAAVWTLWLTLSRRTWNRGVMAFDLAVCAWLILASGLVVEEGAIISGRPFFATGYPLSAPLLWGAMWGPGTGALTALVLAGAHLFSRPINGIALAELDPGQVQNVTGAMLNYLVAGVAVGLVAKLLRRSHDAVRSANEETLKERELSARLAERESLARAIHDSVLQSLAMVHKRGKELASADTISPDEVRRLAELAEHQEAELRALILREPEAPPVGRAALREALEETARAVGGVRVTVSATGPIWMPRRAVVEIQAAVRQALENVVEHAGASGATIFAEEDSGEISVSVRDNGVGFEYDEAALVDGGKVGILRSIKGRAEDLGGRMQVISEPGKGTEVEIRVPKEENPDA